MKSSINGLKIYCENYDFSPLAAAFCGEYESDCTLAAEIEIVDEARVQTLNKTLRGVDCVTDVLSFPALDGIYLKKIKKSDFPYDCDEHSNLFIGSIAICLTRAKQQAAEYGHSEEREINYLAAHGLLHLLGYDHIKEDDKNAMRAKEERILEKLDLKREE